MHSETAFALEKLPCGRRPSQARAVLLLKGPFFRLSTALGRLFARPLALFLLIFVAIAWRSVGALPAVASPTLVQHASKDAGVTLSSSLAFSSNNTAGNWVGVVIRAGHSGQAFAVSDTRGNTYRQAVLFNQTLDTPNGDTFGIFYAENIAGGANTVTVSESISNNTLRFAILEYSGLATTNSLDLPATMAAQGNGTSATSGVASTTSAGDVLIGAVITGSGVTYTAGSGYNIEERIPAAPNTKLIVEDQIQGTPGGVAATATFSASASWGAAVAAFKAAGGGGGAPPSITNLSPASAPVGNSVTITGTNFGATEGSSMVTFNGTPAAAASSWSSTNITVLVPPGASSGSAIVTVGSLSSNGVAFTVLPTPNITNINPSAARVGTLVTITGTNFGTAQGTSAVVFNGTTATPTSWSATSIVVPVATGATTGNVVVGAGGVPSNPVAFTVTPTITGLNTNSGAIGNLVFIGGSNFGPTPSGSTVTFNGIVASPINWIDASITVPVPTGATTGPVVVTVGGFPSNPVNFVVTPVTVTNLNPTSGPVGTAVTITGTNFGSTQGTSIISFGGVLATTTSWSQTSIVVPVPFGAGAAVNVRVGLVNSNSVNFTVIVPPPSITNLSPSSGIYATPVTITGTNLFAGQGAPTVSFNGVGAAVTSLSPTSVGTFVPSGATTGPVVVTLEGVASNGV